MTLSPKIPCVLQIGFAGTRDLWSGLLCDEPRGELRDRVVQSLVNAIQEAPSKVVGSAEYVCCGISQIAVGGDHLFTEACALEGIPQRIFLPQGQEDYLAASNPISGEPDFADPEKHEAIRLLALPHIIEERVTSSVSNRLERFTTTNVEIARFSDVVIGLVRKDQVGQDGGTEELLAIANRMNRPIARIIIHCVENRLECETVWSGPPQKPIVAMPGAFSIPPTASHDLQGDVAKPVFAKIPTIETVLSAIHGCVEANAEETRGSFEAMVRVILMTHVGATIVAMLTYSLHDIDNSLFHSLKYFGLVLELGLLSYGWWAHHRLSGDRKSRGWATARLLAETCRSALATSPSTRCTYDHLFRLPYPVTFYPLLRTMEVLHLIGIKYGNLSTWTSARRAYIERRLTHERDGQLVYYTNSLAKDTKTLYRANAMFLTFTIIALISVLMELVPSGHHSWDGLLSFLAISMPVLAVALLSWANSRDLSARISTYAELTDFLEHQIPCLEDAATPVEFRQLMADTETRLMGETLRWYTRVYHKEVS